MYLIYVDESGDVGLTNSPTRYFILSGLVVHELRWRKILEDVLVFRKALRNWYGLKLREELHAAHFMHRPGQLARIPKHRRLQMLREVLEFEAILTDIDVINVVVDKQSKPAGYNVFESAWKILFQRFHNTINHQNFRGPKNPQDYGMAIVDRTDIKALRNLTRRLRRYNPVPNRWGAGYRDIPLDIIIEDPVHRDSLHSYFIQLADVNAYFLMQKLSPCGYIKKKGGRNYFDRLDPILCKVASSTDPQGIVWDR